MKEVTKKVDSVSEDKKAKLVTQRREQILTAAKRIFAQNGFRCTQIEQIATDLGVGKGTLYRYFKDKKSLFLAVFEDGVRRLREIIQTDVESITDPKKKIIAAVKTYFGFFDSDRELIEIMMQVRSEFKDDYRQVFMATYSDYIIKIQENLQAGINKGLFREMDVEKTADSISAILQGVLQSFYVRELGSETTGMNYLKDNGSLRGERALLADSTEAVTRLILEGLLKRNKE